MDFTQSIDLKILIEHNLWPAWHCEHCRNIPHEHLPARHDYVSALKQWHVLVAQSCPILCDPMNCSPPGSSVRVVLQTRTREWAAMPFSRGSSRTRDWTWVSYIAARFFTIWATRESPRNDIDPWKDDRERKAQWISKYKTEWSRKRRCSGGTVIGFFHEMLQKTQTNFLVKPIHDAGRLCRAGRIQALKKRWRQCLGNGRPRRCSETNKGVQERDMWAPKGRGREGERNQEHEINRCKLPYIK